MDYLNKIYKLLPLPLKQVVVKLRGYQLKRLRYGSDTELLIEKYNEHEKWTKNQWDNYYSEKINQLLFHAEKTVPFYRDYWANKRRKGSEQSSEYLENWPIIEKNLVRKNPKAFLSDVVKSKKLYVDHTSGTTGKPTLIYLDRETVHKWYALHEARTRRWFDVSYKQIWGIFGGQKIINLAQSHPPYWIKNSYLNQVYFSIYHIKKETAKFYIEALWRFNPTHLVVYPSALSTLAQLILEQDLNPPQIKVIFSNAEKIFDHQRALIEKAFRCPIVETYGMAEIVAAGSECEYHCNHWWPEVGFTEILEQSNGIGDYVFTGLMNEQMPLIRYRAGDRGALPDWGTECKCGRQLPLMHIITGRSKDLLITKDGRKLYLLDSLFNDMSIIEGQLIQHDFTKFQMKVVPSESYNHSEALLLAKKRLSEYFGPHELKIELVSNIPREKNGKFRPFISNLNV